MYPVYSFCVTIHITYILFIFSITLEHIYCILLKLKSVDIHFFNLFLTTCYNVTVSPGICSPPAVITAGVQVLSHRTAVFLSLIPPVLRPVRAEAGKGSEYPGRCLVTPGPGRPGCTAGPTPRPRCPPARPAPCKTHPRSTARGDTNGHVTKQAKNDTRDPAEVRTEDLGPPHLSG